MFSDKYKRDNERVNPTDTQINGLKDALISSNFTSVVSKRKKMFYKKIVAIASSFVLLITCITTFHFYKRSESLVSTLPVSFSGYTYNDLYSTIKKLAPKQSFSLFDNKLLKKSPAIPQGASATFEASTSSDKNDFSSTNLQVLGVDEADIVKTDGEYIYALARNSLCIIKVDGENLSIVSNIARTNTYDGFSTNIFEFYINNNTLVAISGYNELGSNNGATAYKADIAIDSYSYYGSSKVVVESFDISNRANPLSLSRLSQSGSYLSSRLVGDILYTATTFYAYNPEKGDISTYVPSIGSLTDSATFSPDDITIMPNPSTPSYFTVTAINTANPDKFVSSKAVLGCGSNLYSSTLNMYITSYDSRNEGGFSFDVTNILKIALNAGNIEFVSSGYVLGSILNQFSLDEFDGKLRIVTTLNKYAISSNGDVASSNINAPSNNLFILDENLKVVGSLENISPNERVYSVRFDGDIGYFVTFRQTDPLFTVDLKNPTSPIILSALKIPGFSQYLHPYKDGLLFGFGMDANEKTGAVNGFKLSMFDTSDKANVTEKNRQFINSKGYSEASYNHKAILVNSDKGIVGFAINDNYFVYGYDDNNGFYQKNKIALAEFTQQMRSFYINNYLYVYTSNYIFCINLDTNITASSLSLR